jgi:DNA repair protein RadA/Sms
MAKVKTAYFCQVCGNESAKWTGKCPSCGQWNTMVEELIQKDNKKTSNDWDDYRENGTAKKTRHLNQAASF